MIALIYLAKVTTNDGCGGGDGGEVEGSTEMIQKVCTFKLDYKLNTIQQRMCNVSMPMSEC